MYVFGSGRCGCLRGLGLGFTNPEGTWKKEGCVFVFWLRWCGWCVWCWGGVGGLLVPGSGMVLWC